MANERLKNIKGLFTNTRTRTILILTGVIILLAIFVGVYRLSGPPPGPATDVSVRSVPGGIQSVPGGFDRPQTPEYARLQEQQNIQQARLAEQRGTSAVPTIIRSGQFGGQGLGAGACCQPCPCPGVAGGGFPLGQASALRPGTLVYDAQGRVIGTVGPDGKVRDANGNVIGTVGPDGLVRDANGNIIGSAGIGASGKPVFDAQGRLIGTVGPDGKVRDANGNVIGTVGPDGTVRDNNGNIIGKVGNAAAGAPVYDSQGRLIGTVGPDGKVRDANGNVIGTVDPDGNVRDLSGNIIGKTGGAIAGATPVYDAQGRLIGTVGPDGKVRDANGKVIGTVGADGIVRDANGKVIGKSGGRLPPFGTPVYDSNGHLIGTVGADGKVRDAKGNIIGDVGPDGLVRDAVTGNVLGKAGSTVPGTPVYDDQGRLIGTVGADGTVRDANGNVVGKVGPDGLVRDSKGNIIGRVGPAITGTPVYDSQGRLMGIAGPDGKVRDANGKVIGTLGANGVVRDLDGNIIGSSSPTAGTQPGAGIAALPTGALTPVPGAGAESQLAAVQQRQAAMVSQQQADQLRNQIQGAMSGQAGQLLAAWVSPIQQYTQGTPPEEKKGARVAGIAGRPGVLGPGGAAAFGPGGAAPPAAKAGTVMFAVLISEINSDEPGPVLATITCGKFRGGRLIGSLTNQGQAVLLSFNTMTLPHVPNSIAVNTVAIDQNTARTGISTYTNNHYLLRYGSLFASAFIQGYGQAFQTSGQTVISTGLATATTTPDLSPAGKFMVALGNVGTRYSAILGQIFNTPPTVHVASGTALGILFLSDVPAIPTT